MRAATDKTTSPATITGAGVPIPLPSEPGGVHRKPPLPIAPPNPWHFIGFLFLVMLIPKCYELANEYWIGRISIDALAITGQYEFIAVTIEIVNEMIPFGILALAVSFPDLRDVTGPTLPGK